MTSQSLTPEQLKELYVQRMVREFKEYRPWTTKEQFEKEIGKYVGAKEVARLWRYVVIE